MIRMVRSCDRSQRRLALFLVAVLTLEVTLISTIIRHEHKLAHKDWEMNEESNKNLKKNATPLSQVIPNVPRALERGKWASSTMRDFTGFGEFSRKQVYDAGKSAFKYNKALQSTELGLLQENFRTPMTTMYGIDYNTNMCGAQMPKCTQMRKELMKTSTQPLPSGSEQFLTEAQYAFKWPSTDRLKAPLHLRSTSVTK